MSRNVDKSGKNWGEIRDQKKAKLKCQVFARAKGMCEDCSLFPGRVYRGIRAAIYVKHPDAKAVRLLCENCAVKDVAHAQAVAQDQRAARGKARRAAKVYDNPHLGCAFCGGTFPKAKHEAVCVKFGVHKRAV